MKHWPLRRRLISVITLAVTAVVALAGIALVETTFDRRSVELLDELGEMAELVDRDIIDEGPEGLSTDVDTRGRLVVASGVNTSGTDQEYSIAEIVRGPGDPPPSAALEDWATDTLQSYTGELDPFDDEFVGSWVEAPDGSEWGAGSVACLDNDCELLTVAGPEPTRGEVVADLAPWILLSWALASGLAALATRITIERTLRPVEAIRSELDDITAASLQRRVPVPTTKDEIESLARTANDTLSRLEESAMAQHRFVADASHELRSPLAGLRAQLELMATHPDKIDLQRTAPRLVAEVDRTAALVDDLLLLAKHDANQPLTSVRLDPLPVISRSVDRLRVSHPDIEVQLGTSGSLAVWCNEGDLERLLTNLTDNAARHARSRVAVVVGSPEGDTVSIHVDDDGSGIPADQKHRVFDRFVRLDEARSREAGGSGLGLAIARSIARRHLGDIEVRSSPLGGARLTIQLRTGPDPRSQAGSGPD